MEPGAIREHDCSIGMEPDEPCRAAVRKRNAANWHRRGASGSERSTSSSNGETGASVPKARIADGCTKKYQWD
jgi:hypothetical protein